MTRKRRRKWRPWLKFPGWARRKLPYKRNVMLLEHEERVLLALIEDRGCAWDANYRWWKVSEAWCRDEPGRWDRQYLTIALKRLSGDKRLRDMLVIENDDRQAA